MPKSVTDKSFSHRVPVHANGQQFLIPNIIREQIHLLVGENDLMQSSALLLELAKFYSPSQSKEVVVLRRAIVEVEKISRLNILDLEQVSRERNRLGYAILDLTDSICLI